MLLSPPCPFDLALAWCRDYPSPIPTPKLEVMASHWMVTPARGIITGTF
jgi:hypothetical protein